MAASSAGAPTDPWGPTPLPGIGVREGLSVLVAGAGPREETETGNVRLYQEIAPRGELCLLTCFIGRPGNNSNSENRKRSYQRHNICKASSPLCGRALTRCVHTYHGSFLLNIHAEAGTNQGHILFALFYLKWCSGSTLFHGVSSSTSSECNSLSALQHCANMVCSNKGILQGWP